MIRKRRTSDWLLYAILVICIYSFKFLLVGVGGTGIRPDDLLILLAFVVVLLGGDFRRVKRSQAFNIYLGFVGVNALSALWGAFTGRVGLILSLVFVARMLQYTIFYYIGYRVAKSGIDPTRMLSYYLLGLCVAVPLQMVGVLPVVGGFEGITTRAVGNTNGPYELAAVAAFLLCYLGYAKKKRVSGAFAFLLILLSASRVTSVATALSLLKAMLTRPRNLRIIGLASAAAVVGFFVFFSSSKKASSEERVGIAARFAAASSGASLSTISESYDNAPVYRTSQEYLDNTFQTAIDDASSGEGDASGLIRIFRWTTVIKSTLASTDSIILGLGPSFSSTAVDGYFVRVFIESGLVGLFMFCWFGKTLLFGQSKSSGPFREYVFIMLATGCFIDIFVSYKPMLLLWLWHGMHQFSLQDATNRIKVLAPGSNNPRSRSPLKPQMLSRPMQSATQFQRLQENT